MSGTNPPASDLMTERALQQAAAAIAARLSSGASGRTDTQVTEALRELDVPAKATPRSPLAHRTAD